MQPTPGITELMIKMLAGLLDALAVATKQINQTIFRKSRCHGPF